MKMLVSAIALVAGLAVATGAVAQSQPSSPPSTSGSQVSPPAPGVLLDANSIIGALVRAQGKDIGKVERLMVDPKDGRVRTVVIQQGGTLGVRGRSVSMPWESIKVAQDGDKIVVSVEQQMLDQAPAASPRTDSKSDSKK
jgi:sporulation protein YlmC with PRC-barrel domain